MLQSELTDWAPAQSDGVLPLEDDADEMQVRHFLNWELDPSGIGIDFQDKSGAWEYQIEGPDGLPVFRQKITETLRLVTLGAPGLELFSWQHLREKIETSMIGGLAVSEGNPAWKYTIGGTALSEFGTLIPGDGTGAVAGSFVISAFHQGPLYQSKNGVLIPAGSRLRVLSDNWALGVSTRPEYQFRFRAGKAGCASLFDRYNALIFAVPVSGGVEIQRRVTQPGILGTLERRAFLPGLSNPAILKGRDNALHLLANEATVGRLWVSEDDGVTWQRVSNRSATGVEALAVIFGTGFKNFRMCNLPNGTTGFKGERDGLLYYANSADISRVETVGKMKADQSYDIAAGADGAVLIYGATHQFELDGSGKPIETGGGA